MKQPRLPSVVTDLIKRYMKEIDYAELSRAKMEELWGYLGEDMDVIANTCKLAKLYDTR